MRKPLLFVIPLILLLTTACSITIGAPELRKERGSGNVITQEREVNGFDQVEFSGVGNMTITQGDQESLTIQADDNLIDHIETKVVNDQLSIDFENNFNFTTPTEIHYTLVVKDLSRLELSGFGNIEINGLNTSSLVVDLSGSGNLTLANLQADSLETTISGFGSEKIDGQVKDLAVNISGAGNFKGNDLRSQTTRVGVSGLGNATVWTETTLDVNISGSGNVSYYGLPRVSQTVSGLGRLEALGNK